MKPVFKIGDIVKYKDKLSFNLMDEPKGILMSEIGIGRIDGIHVLTGDTSFKCKGIRYNVSGVAVVKREDELELYPW